LNLCLYILDGVTRLDLQSDGFSSEGLDKDLHATTESEHKMEGGLLLDVVVRKGPSIFQLLTSKDQPLLVRRDTLFVLDLGLDVLNGIAWFHFQRDGFASKGLDKNLHASTQPKH